MSMNKANNQGFKSKRVSRSYCQTINAKPEIVFPLLCPVREAEWLDGWKYNLIYSETGFAEKGCIFSTPHKEEEDTIWIITEHDKEKSKGSCECRIDVQLSRLEPVAIFVALYIARGFSGQIAGIDTRFHQVGQGDTQRSEKKPGQHPSRFAFCVLLAA